MDEESLLGFVRDELAARKGQWMRIAREMDPDKWESYYSWMTKVADGRIPDPGVIRIEELASKLRREQPSA